MATRWISIALGLASVMAWADEPAAPKGWERSLALGFSLTSGNSDSVLFTGSLQGQHIQEKNEWRLSLDGAYGKTDGTKSTESVEAKAQYNRLLNERLYASLIGDAFHDGVSDVAYRMTIGPGLGYYFIKSPRTRLSAEIGPSFVVEKLDGHGVHEYMGLRLGERFERKLSEGAKLWQSLEIVPQVDDFENFVATTEIGVEAALTKTLSVRIVGRDIYDNQPAANRERNDIQLISALAYKF